MRGTGLLVLGILAIGVVSVSAGGPYHEEGWFSSLTHRIGSMMPWGSKLGHDHSDTLAKVENIYEKTHEAAQRRVDELKENIVKDSDIQKLIADIYHEEAQRAEKEIEGLKHPMLEWLMHWRASKGAAATAAGDVADKAADAAKGMAAKLSSELADLPGKVTGHYKSALETAKSAAEKLPVAPSWEEAKQKAHEVYSHAFHKGHGETRTFLGKLRDTVGRGASSTASMAKSAACHTWDFLTHSIMAGLYILAGAGLGCWAVAFWNRRKFEKQLDSHVSGPIIAVGEYMMVGGEEVQRKFYDFWSGPAALYFNRQPGLRRQYMHRGVPGAGNMWLSYSEWATIDDLRRAVRNQEFAELKKRAPKATVHKMTLYQLGASGARHEVDGDASKESAEQRGLRQRGTGTGTGTSTS